MSRSWFRLLSTMVLCLPAVASQAQSSFLLSPQTDRENDTSAFLSRDSEVAALRGPVHDVSVESTPSQRWSVWVGAIFLQRAQPSSQPLVVNSSRDTLFDASQIGFFAQGGPDVNALYRGDYFDLDFRYFQVNQAGAIDSMASVGDEFLNTHTPVFLDGSPVDFHYTTSIQSVEFNVRRNYTERLAMFAGFRYLSLRDDLSTGFFPPGGAPWSTVQMVGINRLYGAQIGANLILLDGGRWQIQCAPKAGLYGNGAQSLGLLSTPQAADVSHSESRMLPAFVGDLSFTGVYALTDHWALRGGYQLLWLSGVALGSDQFATTSYVYAQDASVATGSLFLHGALVSLQYSW